MLSIRNLITALFRQPTNSKGTVGFEISCISNTTRAKIHPADQAKLRKSLKIPQLVAAPPKSVVWSATRNNQTTNTLDIP